MTIGVGDKATGQPLGGAVVFLSCGKDTLESVTDNYGNTFFSGIPFAEDKDPPDSDNIISRIQESYP